MLVVHGTKTLRDRVRTVAPYSSESSTTRLGDWYATAMFWRPQVALFVNEATLLPVLVPLAPPADLVKRLAGPLAGILAAHGATTEFVETEMIEMSEVRLAQTANRSVVGVMNEFTYLANVYSESGSHPDLFDLSLSLAKTPCGPLRHRHVSPDRELAALLSERQ